MSAVEVNLPIPQIAPGCFPYGFKQEFKAIFKLAWPTSLSILFHQLLQPISLAFCGHLGNVELAAVATALSVIYMTTISVCRGLAFAGDTFFSQTYGSTNKTKMGVYLQKALIFGVFASLFTIALILNTENLLLLARQPPDVARLAHKFCLLFSPGALAYCWLFILMRYLLCQNRVIPNLVICIVSCAICAILNYGLVYQAKMGVAGSAIALALTYYLVVIQLVSYIWATGIYKETWSGWTWECLLDWVPFAKVCLPSILMTVIFWFYTEVGTFLSGLLSPMAISAFSIHFQVEGFSWMIPLGLGSACTARIGQYLGANDPTGAINSSRVTLIVQIFVSVVLAALTYFLRYYIPQMFTNKLDVVDYTASILSIVSLFILLEGIGGVGVGIVRGTGRQTLGAGIIFATGYLLSLPIGIPLMFLTKLGLAGLWWGYCVGLAAEDLFLMLFLAKLDWIDESQKAQKRAGTLDVDGRPLESNGDSQQEEVDETAGLLRTSRSSVNRPDVKTVNWSLIIVTRLAILLALVSLVVGSFFIQMYVHVPVSWAELCVPVNSTGYDVSHMNETLPICVTNNNTRYSYHFPANEMIFASFNPM